MNLRDYYEAHHRFYLNGSVNSDMVDAFDKQVEAYFLLGLDERKPIAITITTFGGSAGSGQDMHERIRMLNAVAPVVLVASGHCSSAGVPLLMAVPVDRRFATRHTEFLMHQPWYEPQKIPRSPLGIRRLIIEDLAFDEECRERFFEWMVKIVARGCSKPKKEVRSLMFPGSVFTGRKAVEFGLVSKLLV